jgi:hypothetical protein
MRYSTTGRPRLLTEKQIERIRFLRSEYFTPVAELAERYGVSPQLISYLTTTGGREYKSAPPEQPRVAVND